MVTGAALRVVFFGTPDFAVPSFDALLGSRHQVTAVVTRPDRPRGRGLETSDTPVKARAAAAQLTILQPDRLGEAAFLARFAGLRPDLGVVAAYGKILPEALLAAPRLGMINVHASLLPHYRGAAPVHRAVIAGELETGVTIMRMVKALDAGPMLASAKRPIGRDETSEEIEQDLARIGADLLLSVVDKLASGPVDGIPQDEAKATYAQRLTRADGVIDWTWPAERIHDLIRGLHPWPHAFSFLHGRRCILLKSLAISGSAPSFPVGTVIHASSDRLVIAAGQGSLQILQIQTEGKRAMSVREFLAGHHVAAGDRLSGVP